MHAAHTPTRCYFYSVDLQGRLFLEETLPKNIATSIKDAKFLDFFFRRVRRVNVDERALMKERQIPVEDYPFVSPCGKELNFIRPAATPIVFHSLTSDNNRQLLFGGNLAQPLNVACIAVSFQSGRLYHELTKHSLQPRGEKDLANQTIDYGLIRSSVAVALSERIIPFEDVDASGEYSGMAIIGDEGPCPIPWLPISAEPGQWALPLSASDAEEKKC